jgi:hypothetical protein
MNKMKAMLNMAGVLLACVVCGSVAQAQAPRTWVSGVGDDANPCSRTAPCKTFAGAISKTANNGEIDVLDPGGFGALTITKSITIDGRPVEAGVLVSGTNGIVVAATASDKVILRGLDFNGSGTGINGITFSTGAQLSVEGCMIQGFTNNGIDVSRSTAGNIYIKDTNITKVGNAGINLTDSVAGIVANIENVKIEGVPNGIVVGANTFATIARSSIFQNPTNGIQVSGSGSVANIESTTVTFNGVGLNASVSGATIRISNVDVFNNQTGISAAGGSTVLSFFNCRIAGNATNGAPTNQQAQQ